MNTYAITFRFNDFEKIVIEIEEPFNLLHCCYQSPIVLYFENKTYWFKDEVILYRINLFVTLLTKALKNELKLHQSIKEDIGYLANEDLQNKPNIVRKETKSIASWVGDDYFLWSGDNVSTWLYNDKNGNIVFEITPNYKYHFCNLEETPGFIPYEVWAKKYKPCLIRIIPKDIAQQWLDKARKILNIIETNMAREKKMFVNAQDKEIYNEWCTILEEEYGITDPKGADADKVPTEFQTDEWWKKRGL